MVAVISGDIISSTSFTDESRTLLEEKLEQLLINLKTEFNVFGRVIKGDYLECVIPEPENIKSELIAEIFELEDNHRPKGQKNQ